MSTEYQYSNIDQTPHLQLIHDEVASSDMTSKAIEYCEYDQDSSNLSVYFTNPLNSNDQTSLDGIVADSTGLPGVKAFRKDYLDNQGNKVINGVYSAGDQRTFTSLYEDALRFRPNRIIYVQDYINWIHDVEVAVENKITEVDDATSIDAVNAIELDSTGLTTQAPSTSVEGTLDTSDDTSLSSFLDANAVVTDASTGISGPYYLMEILNHRKDLYNDSTNPIYDSSHTPILGTGGFLVDHANRILNLEIIHGKLGWHNQEIIAASYSRPKDLLIYYGYPNSFNSGINGWNNENVSQDMARYNLIVLGDGVEDPSHPDYANTQVIIPRVQALNCSTQIFGYVSVNQTFGDFTNEVDQWGVLGVSGIFMDEAGYDYGKTRAEFNQRVDYIHDRTSTNICFANAWNTDNILGTANDPSYPNSTYNDTSAESNLTTTDWILLESFPINTASYTASTPDGYESATDWKTRGDKMATLRYNYGVNFAAAGIINNANSDNTAMFEFSFISSMMYCLEAHGTSDTGYGAGSAQVNYYPRPDVSQMGKIYDLNCDVQLDVGDSSRYHKYVESGKFSLDFSDNNQQDSTITKF